MDDFLCKGSFIRSFEGTLRGVTLYSDRRTVDPYSWFTQGKFNEVYCGHFLSSNPLNYVILELVLSYNNFFTYQNSPYFKSFTHVLNFQRSSSSLNSLYLKKAQARVLSKISINSQIFFKDFTQDMWVFIYLILSFMEPKYFLKFSIKLFLNFIQGYMISYQTILIMHNFHDFELNYP